MATWRDVSRLALALPGTSEERRSNDMRSWIVNKRFFVWERPLRHSDILALGPDAPKGPILGARTADLEMKDVLIASDRNVFFTTPHFDGYPAILIRLQNIGAKTLKDVIVEAWLARASKTAVAEYLKRSAQNRGVAARRRAE
jgi:hypothetical protein